MDAIRPTVPAHFARGKERFPDRPTLEDREGVVRFAELLASAAATAEGLRRAGVRPGDRVGFYADNSRRWIQADLAIQLARGISVPRGTDTPVDEMVELFRHAEVGLVLAHGARQAEALATLRSRAPTMTDVVCLDPAGARGRTLDALAAEGRGGRSFEESAAAVEPKDVATIIYTSGTTGRPKGVVLAQENFGHQLRVLPEALDIREGIAEGEVFLSILPPWHIFERIVEYVALTQGAKLVYTDRRRFKEDMAKYAPTFVPSVPRIWETVYNGVRKTLEEGSPVRRTLFRAGYAAASLRARAWDRARGHVLRVRRPRGLGVAAEGAARAGALFVAGLALLPDRLAHRLVFAKLRKLTGSRLRGAVSGGGLMPAHVDRFFRGIELPILVGYGLTETSPVLTVRRRGRNVLGTIGTAVPEVELEIRHVETGRRLPVGEVGVVFTRGPQVMRGYYKDPELTKKAIDAEGWFDTGDLGFLTEAGDLVFCGRAKETIVLSGGENVEPGHVEESILASPLVEQAVVVGQDRKTLAALVLPEPEATAKALGLAQAPSRADLAAMPAARTLLKDEIVRRTADLKPFERVARVALLGEPLDPSNGCLTQTLKPKRHVIVERFASLIEEAYA
jgi:long-chain acyl-CoA synthetase